MAATSIIITDRNIYSKRAEYTAKYGYGACARIAREQGVSRETISRKCRRYEEYLKYQDIYDALPFKLARHMVRFLTMTITRKNKNSARKKKEEYDQFTIGRIFNMSDRQLKRIPMMGPKRIQQFKEAREKYLCKKL